MVHQHASLPPHLGRIEAQINALLTVAAEVKTRVEQLTQVAGVRPVSAYPLLAYLPELGKLSRGAIAALASVAPMNADNGPIRGQRHIRTTVVYVHRQLTKVESPLDHMLKHARGLLAPPPPALALPFSLA